MEPILELATRITTHLWFLHDLFPEEPSLRRLLTGPWRKKTEPKDYARLRNLLDLADVKVEAGLWTADAWLWPYRKPPKPKKPLSLREWWRCRSLRKDLEQLRKDWTGLARHKRTALTTIEARVKALRDHPLDEGREAEASAGRQFRTREELFEWVVEGLLRIDVLSRVELAMAFMPDHKFFVEEQITQSAESARRHRAPRVCPGLPEELQGGRLRQSSRYDMAMEWRTLLDEANTLQRFKLLLEPTEFRELCLVLSVPVPFSMVLRDELNEIARSRATRLSDTEPSGIDGENRLATGVFGPKYTPERQAFRSRLFSLAFSGGGIRSATFALGLLQSMADRNILPQVDVLSTVSGGGYIGSWLISWIKRKGGVASVQQSMSGNATPKPCASASTVAPQRPAPDPYGQVSRNADPESDHVRPVRLLRHYASYLAPRNGLFEADTWTIGATWLRNTLLNLLILTAFLGALILLPRIAAYLLVRQLFLTDTGHTPALSWRMFALASGFVLAACWVIGARDLSKFGPSLKSRKAGGAVARGDSDAGVALTLGLALIGTFFEIAFFWYAQPAGIDCRRGGEAWAVTVLLACVVLGFFRNPWAVKGWKWWKIAVSLLAGATGGALAAGVYYIVKSYANDTERGVWFAASIGLPLALAANGLTVVLFVGLMGNLLSDEQREWWGRMGALLCIAIAAWLIVCGVCFFAPLGIAQLGIAAAGAGGAWALITGWGTKLAFSPKSGRDGAAAPDWKTALGLAVAPPVFVLGLLCLASFGAFLLVDWAMTLYPQAAYAPVSPDLLRASSAPSARWIVNHYWPLLYAGSYIPLVLILALAAVSLLLAWRVDINQFSMHNFYKNRLVRCYLGASRARRHRAANAFTGFDLEDDIRLVRFQHADRSQPGDMALDCQPGYAGPFPILNTALNVTQGQDLGLQERKAESFVFTPLWSGFDFSRRQAAVRNTQLGEYGYRQTREFGEPENLGASLGTAMAISGAAFNSNMGFHTTPALAFLLTVFGVRLGWWAGNPRFPTWECPSPPLGIGPLARELTANTTTDSDFVLLSDGGHFENMGLYELVRRRCRYVIVVDAEEDEKFKLEGIGGAIRKCRIDFGVVIDLNLEVLQPLGDPAVSKLHYSLASVRYPGEEECGRLIYIKSSVTGDEPVDVVEFRKRHPEFPHTSTADQFFDESHFESYRALGQHVGGGIFLHDVKSGPIEADEPLGQRVDELFRGVEGAWKLRLAAVEKEKKGEGKSGDKKA